LVVENQEVSVSSSEEVNGNRAKQVDTIISEWSRIRHNFYLRLWGEALIAPPLI
jgi:hypothetical protein